MESTNIDIDKIIKEIKISDNNTDNDKLYEEIKKYYNKEHYLYDLFKTDIKNGTSIHYNIKNRRPFRSESFTQFLIKIMNKHIISYDDLNEYIKIFEVPTYDDIQENKIYKLLISFKLINLPI